MLSKHTRLVADNRADAVGSGLVDIVKPRRDEETLRGVYTMTTRVQQMIGKCAPEVRPHDTDVAGVHADRALARNAEATANVAIDAAAYQVEESGESADNPAESEEVREVRIVVLDHFSDRMTVKEFIAIDEHGDAGVTMLTVVFEWHHAMEAPTTIDAVSKKMKMSRVAAFMHALRGICEVEMNLGLFRMLPPGVDGEPEGTPAWLTGAGWLSLLVAESQLKRVSTLRVLGDNTVEGYRLPELQRAFMRAHDGICSFPDCDVPAERCDTDHIVEFDHSLSGGERQTEGATHTENLHCLCRRHHNLKTAGTWRVAKGHDGVEAWTLLSCNEGSLARLEKEYAEHGRYAFVSRTEKKTVALTEHNEKRRKSHNSSHSLVGKARCDMRRGREKVEKDEGDGDGGKDEA